MKRGLRLPSSCKLVARHKYKLTINMYKLSLIMTALCLVFACNSDTVKDFEIVEGLVLESPPPYNQQYGITSSLVGGEGDVESIVGYNSAQHSLDVFSVKERKKNSISFEREGPEVVDEIRFIQYVSKDSIFIASRNVLLIVNSHGDVVYRYSIKLNWGKDSKAVLPEFYQPYFVGDGGVQAFFNKEDGEFYFKLNYHKYPRFVSKESYQEDVVLFASLNLVSKDVKALGIRYPEKMRNTMYGGLSKIHCEMDDGVIYYGFQGFPEIYRFELSTGETKMFGEFSKSNEPAVYLAGDDLLEHLLKYTHYLDIRINKHKGVIYRFINVPNDKGRHDLVLQEYSLTDYRLVSEGFFPKWRSLFGVMMAKKGMYVPIMDGEEDELAYAFIK
ncbi:MAG: DUF4221 family protein [Lewinella sp.]